MALTVANALATTTLTLGVNTPQQILVPDGIESAELWLSSTVDITISSTSANAASGFLLPLGAVYRLPLHAANASTPTAKQAVWVNATVGGTLRVMHLGTTAAIVNNP